MAWVAANKADQFFGEGRSAVGSNLQPDRYEYRHLGCSLVYQSPGQLHDRPSTEPTVRLLGSKINEATIASSGAFLHVAMRALILIAAPSEGREPQIPDRRAWNGSVCGS